MPIEYEIEEARKEIVSDGYDMSVGEIINLYRDHEIVISPDFQRLFRWDQSRKTRFIESLLLGIPIPPIFVFQDEDGVWELIDGLQRLSTIFEFVGILGLADGTIAEPSVLEGTRFLPSLAEKRWEASSAGAGDEIGRPQQLQIKRARMRVEILKQESDPQAKYELFQRLNTGGVELSEQEVRNCVAVMVNKTFHSWLVNLATNDDFLKTIDQTEYALKKQVAIELVLRFFVFRKIPYESGLDVHEYLDEAMLKIATSDDFDFDSEQSVFDRTFHILQRALAEKAFKRWDGADFRGKFLMSVFEVLAIGLSKNLEAVEQMSPEHQDVFVIEKAKALWSNETFQQNSGAGIRGTTRLANLLPMAEDFIRP
jgi:hypothetical protein